MGFDVAHDLETGSPNIFLQYKRLISYVHTNKRFFKLYFFCGFCVLLAVVVKYTYMNMENVMQTASTITLDEPSYVPFDISESIVLNVDNMNSKYLPIKHSPVNQKLQITNICALEQKIKIFLEKSGHICLHARHYRIPYDIIVFKNFTMVNPSIVSTSDEFLNQEEQDLAGEVKWAKRPVTVTVTFLDSTLVSTTLTLFKHQSICFSHYSIKK